MSRMTSALTARVLAVLLVTTGAGASELKIAQFSTGSLKGWDEQRFKASPTSYSLVQDHGRTVLQAHSQKSASGMLHKTTVDLKKTPVLSWSWKISAPLLKEDISTKKGDDFAARVYVVFPRSFWRTRAINYVWSAHMAAGSSAPSPYTGNVMLLAVESGGEKAGTWVHEERNVYEDYRRLFGEEPPPVGAIAVMTDTDNTGGETTSWYGDISLHEKRGGASQ